MTMFRSRLVRMSLLLAIALHAAAADSISIDSGANDLTACSSSQIWSPQVTGYVPMGAPPWDKLRYAPAFSCTFPLTNGFYVVDVLLIEPTKTAAAQRWFTVSVNGSTSAPLDLFALAGLRIQYTLRLFAVVNNGVLKLDLRATTGNAVLTGIRARPLALSDLVTGTITGGSVLVGGKYVDVYDNNYAAWSGK